MPGHAIRLSRFLASMLAASVAWSGIVTAQVSTSNVVHLTGKIVKVDHATRHVTLRAPDGHEETVSVSPDVRNFDQVKAGDQVNIDYTRSLLVQMEPKGEVGATASESIARAPQGGLPGAAGVRRLVTTSKVIAVDTTQNTITLEGPNGQQYTLGVEKPEWQARLKKVKPGEYIRATYDEGLAVAVTQ
ncbi:hypothetical protein FHW69_003203 [Luteibacter sp. Sphag1AF]|uniref:hypothetical protein n=1 Tax=Luteibacter sp. Sphag1AF TaxID=2587031 RepID=UPI001619C632|nr:hypothetical protein [Luteibacter sp. Sphag1AF]MBB3228561.1 hypothetical protein [Luteibacter sp. Sphag1AF]